MTRVLVAVVACTAMAVAAASCRESQRVSPGVPAVTTAAPVLTPAASPSPSVTRIGGATPAPIWLGTRTLPVGANGFAAAQDTPPELRNRSIITVDDLPPPADGGFHSAIRARWRPPTCAT
jgi:hypothetical protein